MSDRIKTRDACKAFAATHLAQCAAELCTWQDTAILCDGRLRELAAMCSKFIDNHDGLRVAESMVNRAALDFALAGRQAVAVPEDHAFTKSEALSRATAASVQEIKAFKKSIRAIRKGQKK